MQNRVWLVETPGEKFTESEVPIRSLQSNEVLVRIAASGVNPLDTKIRAGKATHAKQPLPAVLGLDMAGTVEEVGSGVTTFRVGEEVYGLVGGVGGRQGTLAEFVIAGAGLLARKPGNLSFREAAALPLSTITAWEGLVDRAQVHATQKVLIHAGAGGVGHVAVQIARAFEAEVFATVSPSKISWKGLAQLPSTTIPAQLTSTSACSPMGSASTSSMTPLVVQRSTHPSRQCADTPATL